MSGDDFLDDEQIEAAGAVDLGTPLVRVDLDEIQARIAELPPVESVEVHRSWPHTVVDRRRRADRSGGRARRTALVGDGRRRRGLPRDRRPRAGPADGDARRRGGPVGPPGGRRRWCRALPADLLADVRQVSARSMDSITLAMKNKTEIKWGSADESDRKVEVLGAAARRRSRRRRTTSAFPSSRPRRCAAESSAGQTTVIRRRVSRRNVACRVACRHDRADRLTYFGWHDEVDITITLYLRVRVTDTRVTSPPQHHPSICPAAMSPSSPSPSELIERLPSWQHRRTI